jgi:glycosidase
MQELRKIKPDIYCVGECWSGDTEILEYYTAMNCFNFATSQAEGVMASAARGLTIGKYTNYIASMQEAISGKNPDSMLMPFLSNHDMDRIAGSFITENNMRMAANLCLLSPGSPVIYYGEEIGMRGSRGGANTDANRRLAMLWGDGDTVRNPTGTNYPSDKQIATTVTSQLEDEASLLRYYCKLLTIRHKYPAIARGLYTSLDCGEKNLGGFSIAFGEETLGLFHNNGTEPLSFDLSELGFTQLCDFIGMADATLEGTLLTVGPQTSVIVK